MNTLKLAAFLVTVSGTIGSLSAETIRWINNAGGIYTAPSNWDLGRVPLATDEVIFDLNGTYTISVAAGVHPLARATVLNGCVVLDGPGILRVVPDTPPSGVPSSAGPLIIGDGVNPAALVLRDVSFEHFAPGEALRVSNQGTLEVQGGNNYISNVANLQHGSILRVKGGFLSPRLLNILGDVVITGGLLNGDVVTMAEGSSVYATGSTSRFTCESAMQLSGEVTVTDGARLEKLLPGSGFALVSATNCDLVVSDGGQANLDSITIDADSRVEVQQGGIWRAGSTAQFNGPFIARADADVRLDGQFAIAPDLDQAATISRGSVLDLPNGLTVEIDGQIDSVTPIIPRATIEASSSVLGGPLTLRLRHLNGLRLGDAIPIFGHPSGDSQVFTSLIAPAIGGGRALQMVREGDPAVTSVLVVQGPPSCYLDADFDGNGDVGTDADIEAFFACLAGQCCPTCATVDFNGDGDTGTDADIEAFFTVLGGGSC